jgi:hypothetical protein
MWAIIKAILIKLGVARWLIAVLGSLLAVLPIVLALIKFLGWPLLVVLFIVGLPLLLVLALIGFPIVAVVAITGIVMGIAFAVIKVGILLLKLFLFVVLPAYVAWKVLSWAFRRRGGDEGRAPERPTSAETAP